MVARGPLHPLSESGNSSSQGGLSCSTAGTPTRVALGSKRPKRRPCSRREPRIGARRGKSRSNRRHGPKLGLTYALLSDPQGEAIRRYDLLHQAAGPNGTDIARPAEFLIDSDGTVRWFNLTESVVVRAEPGQVLRAFDDLKMAGRVAK